MEWLNWAEARWYDLFATLLGVTGLWGTAYTIRQQTRRTKVDNAIALTNSHRELWSILERNPRLNRVLDPQADLHQEPPTIEEELFVQMMILHLRTALKAREVKLDFDDENVAADVREVFVLPIPKAVWRKTKHLHGADLHALIDGGKFGK